MNIAKKKLAAICTGAGPFPESLIRLENICPKYKTNMGLFLACCAFCDSCTKDCKKTEKDPCVQRLKGPFVKDLSSIVYTDYY